MSASLPRRDIGRPIEDFRLVATEVQCRPSAAKLLTRDALVPMLQAAERHLIRRRTSETCQSQTSLRNVVAGAASQNCAAASAPVFIDGHSRYVKLKSESLIASEADILG